MYNYQFVRSHRKTLSLEITKDCAVLVRAPMRISTADIDAFVRAHEDWISTHLDVQRRRREAAPPPPTAEEITALKAKARIVLPQKVAYYAQKMGVAPQGVKITAARTRYGSCSARNSLCFSCFLMDCPEEAIDLVVVHELSHIRHKNHGPQFYQQLSGVFPDWKERKKLLHMR
jgi:predicted metal-dependent hydrolase